MGPLTRIEGYEVWQNTPLFIGVWVKLDRNILDGIWYNYGHA